MRRTVNRARSVGAVSLRRQVMLSTMAVTAAAMVLMTVLVQLVLAAVVDNNVNRELQDRVTAVLTSIDQGILPTTSSGQDERLGAGALIFDAEGRLLSGQVPENLEHVVQDLRTTATRRTVDANESVRVLAVPFATPPSGVVVVAEPLTPYERTERYALYVTAVLGALATLGAGVVASTAVRRSLRPVVVMAERADDWSEHDLSQRFGLGPPTTELTALATTLDRLLDRVATALRTEQRLTADIAHELRTPLTAILGTADLALLDGDLPAWQRESFETISAAAHRLNETVTTLVEVARSPGGLAGEPATVGDVLSGLDSSVPVTADLRTRQVHLAAPARVVVRTLAPVLDNAARYAGGARLSVRVDQDQVHFVVDDDGPGVPAGDLVFEPGAARSQGAGLGLALSRRVARSCGGDVVTEPTGHGARFVVRLPRR